jgi:hypothetical protein
VTDTAGWYQRKMASLRGGLAPSPPQRGSQQYPQQQAPQYVQQQGPLQYQQPQQMPQVTIENLFGAMGFWRGGKAHQIDREPCPECGSNQYYSRSQGARRGPPPAPHCYNCGYNGLFEQGDATTWGATT